MSPWIERQRNLLEYALSSLLRRKTKNGALVLVYTLMIFILGSVSVFTHSLRKEASFVLEGSPDIVVQRMIAGRHDLIPGSYLAVLEKIRGTAGARLRLWGYYYDPFTRANYTLIVPEHFSGEPGSVGIGKGIARIRRLAVDDFMVFRAWNGETKMFRISEILSPSSELLSSDLVVLSEEDFRDLFGIGEGLGTDIALSVRNPLEIGTVAAKITAALPDTRPITRLDMMRTYDAVFQWRSGMVLVLLSGAVLSFLILAWDKATGLNAEEVKEIGILKAVGWKTSDVLLVKMYEGMIISSTAFLSGMLLAYAHIFFGGAILFESALKGWAVLYPEFRLTPFIDISQLATICALTVVPYTAATIVPSWRAAIADPDAVMR